MHIQDCQSCAQELSDLKAVIKELNGLPKIKASDDFLQKVHQRIERRDEFEGIMRKLFSPAKIKLPAEIAGVLVTALIVIGFFHTLNQDQQLSQQFIYYKTPEKVKSGPVELAFVMSPWEALSNRVGPVPVARMADTADMYMARSKDMVREERSLSMAETKIVSGLAPSQKEPLLGSLRDLIEGQGGKIISVDSKANNMPKSLIIEILPSKLQILLEELKQLGSFQTPLPSKIPQGEIPIQIRLKILDQ
jgi:hypothetical protein